MGINWTIEYERNIYFAEHEILLSFVDDEGAEHFENWWCNIGQKKFKEWYDNLGDVK